MLVIDLFQQSLIIVTVTLGNYLFSRSSKSKTLVFNVRFDPTLLFDQQIK